MLIAFAWGQLFKSEGDKLIVEGDGFSNTLTQYDDFKSGNLFSDDDLVPFSFNLKNFVGTYERTGPNRGTPRTYQADITYSLGAYGKAEKHTVKVNEPLEIGDSKVYLVSHGYAPVVTVRDGKGKVVFHQAVPMLPIDSNVTSQGAIKVLDGYRNAQGVAEQLGFAALFVPTYAKGSGTMFSQYPGLDYPVLNVTGYHGDLGVNSGIPQNVYQLDTKNLKQFKTAKGAILKSQLLPGETMKLPNGAGSITFDKQIKEWAGFQVVQQPGTTWALAGALTAIVGLAGSPVHPAPPRLGAGEDRRRRCHRRRDGRARPQRVREAPRGTRRPGRARARPGPDEDRRRPDVRRRPEDPRLRRRHPRHRLRRRTARTRRRG